MAMAMPPPPPPPPPPAAAAGVRWNTQPPRGFSHLLATAQVIQKRLEALEEDNYKEEDFGAAGSDDEEFELPAGSDEGARAPGGRAAAAGGGRSLRCWGVPARLAPP